MIKKKSIILISIILVFLLILILLKPNNPQPQPLNQINCINSSTQLGLETTDLSRDLQNILLLQANSIRIPLRWQEIEPAKDNYDFSKTDNIISLAEKNNLSILFSLITVSNWATQQSPIKQGNYLSSSMPTNISEWNELLEILIKRYSNSSIQISYEINNEVNAKAFWSSDIKNYTLLLQESYKTIKLVNPSTKVVSSALACGITQDIKNQDQAKALEILKSDSREIIKTNAYDILAIHDYYFPDKKINNINFELYLKEILNIMSQENIQKPIWITEFGYTSKDEHIGSRLDKSNQVLQASRLIQS